ncbi:NrfD/PsrC family molybdoenzyme membrane anchor subunit [Flindersiella endophytica]
MKRGEQEMVPDAEFGSYYGRPILKQPTWKVPDVPLYLFLGGLSGVSATTSAAAELAGYRALARTTRYVAAGGALGSVGALVHDLGRPERFLNMLRVFKPTSPLSVGSWILAPFSGLAVAAALSAATGLVPRLGQLAGAAAGVLGPGMATYTAVLLADTAIPAWHEHYPELPFLFAGSALASAGGAAMMLVPERELAPVRTIIAVGAGLEQAAASRIERGDSLAGEPYRIGRPRRLLQAGRALTAAGGGLALLSRRSRVLSALAGSALLAGGLCTRFGIFYAGKESARDPKYVVVPQRERRRFAEEAHG